jgi:hypothetical protein
MKFIEIFYKDLKEEAQKEILNFYEIKSLEEMNLDITPLCILETEDEEDLKNEK